MIDSLEDLKYSVSNLIRHLLFWQNISTYDEKEIALSSTLDQIDVLFQSYAAKGQNIISKTEYKEESVKSSEIKHSQQSQGPKMASSSQRTTYHKRGPYKKYSTQVKEQALKKIEEGCSLRTVCEDMSIPKKNLKRWIDMGAERKKGGGRKRMDEKMEQDLYKWCVSEGIKNGRPVSRKMIRQRALELSKFPHKFKASKGWTDKFVKKFNLRKKVIKELQEQGLYKRTSRAISSFHRVGKTECKVEDYIKSDEDDNSDQISSSKFNFKDHVFLDDITL